MSYWKSKVLPRIKKYFDKGKKKGASEVCRSFETSKDSLEKELVEKTDDLHPKVIEIYGSSTFIKKKLLKEPNEAAIKGDPDEAHSILQELATAGFPGAQLLSDAAGKFGPASLPGPILYLLTKTSTFLVEEPLPEQTRQIPIEALQPAAVTTPQPPAKEPEIPSLDEKAEGSPATETPIAETGTSTAVESLEDKKEKAVDKEEKHMIVPVEEKKEVEKEEHAVALPLEEKKEVEKTGKAVTTLPLEEKKETVQALEEKKEVEKTGKEVTTLPLEEKKKTVKALEEKKEVEKTGNTVATLPLEEKKETVQALEEKKENTDKEEKAAVVAPLQEKREKVDKEEETVTVAVEEKKETVEKEEKVILVPPEEKKEKLDKEEKKECATPPEKTTMSPIPTEENKAKATDEETKVEVSATMEEKKVEASLQKKEGREEPKAAKETKEQPSGISEKK